MNALLLELTEALEYMVDVHHGDVARDGEDQAPYQQAAYYKAIAASRKSREALRVARPISRMDKTKAAVFLLEQRQPLKTQMRAELQTIGERITKGLVVLLALEELSDDDRIKRRGAFDALCDRYALLAWQVSAPLPTTDLAVCRACKTINLPIGPGAYKCACGALWHPHPSFNAKALPDGFWVKYRPGMKYTRLEPTLDGRGRPEVAS